MTADYIVIIIVNCYNVIVLDSHFLLVNRTPEDVCLYSIQYLVLTAKSQYWIFEYLFYV